MAQRPDPLNKQLTSTTSETEAREQVISNYVKNIAALNLYRPMEPAGSRGSIGIGMGLGMQATDQSDYDQLHYSELGIQNKDSSMKRTGNKVYFVKGLFAPVDLGLTAAAYDHSNLKSAGAHLQVTIYEGFQLPAISLRFSHARLFGLKSSTLSSNALDLGVSYGLLRYFTVYGGIGVSRHTATVDLASGQDTSWLLTANETSASIRSEGDEAYQFAGLNIRFLPPFISATVETGSSGKGLETIAGKVSVGL